VKPTLPAHLLETVRLIAAGHSNQEIANLAHVSVDAVRSRIVALLKILGARDRAHVVALAYQTGLLDVGEPGPLNHLIAVDVPVGLLVAGRVALGWTQAEMAQRLGKSTTWLSNRENGRQPFTVGTAREYALLVGVDLGVPM
jgi:DNA-binding CsgD family transcriptional regulator/DNA-binding XRE family transcriptional regulator